MLNLLVVDQACFIPACSLLPSPQLAVVHGHGGWDIGTRQTGMATLPILEGVQVPTETESHGSPTAADRMIYKAIASASSPFTQFPY